MSTKRSCGLVGCGTVGTGVVRLWREAGEAPPARLKTVAVRDVGKARGVDLSGLALTADPWEIVRDPEIGLVVETTGDVELARALAHECFEAGQSFVTAGKALVARFGPELEEHARERGVAFRYEAAAGGALPIVALLRLGLSPGRVRGFQGVLNGTCNFILSRLDAGLPFDAALAEARVKGFAEPDSSRDTSGRDAADKLVILARLCGVEVAPGAVPTEGILGLRPEDAAFGRRQGWSLRLVASFHDEGASGVARVAPAFVPRSSVLALARDEENVIVLDGGPAGTVCLVGRGAGSLPTASAILADVREVLGGAVSGVAPPRRSVGTSAEADDALARHYLRVDAAGDVARDAVAALRSAGVSLEVLTSEFRGRLQAVTAPAPGAAVRRALASLPARERVIVTVRDAASAATEAVA